MNPRLNLFKNKKIVLVHDWLTGMRGGENVLLEICKIFPSAPIKTLFYSKGKLDPNIESHDIEASQLNKIPGSKKYYRYLLPLFPMAIESFDFRDFDIIISTSHAVAKGVIPGPNTFHLSYIHTPMRWAWDMRGHYFGDLTSGWLLNPKKRFIAKELHKIRIWDASSASRANVFLANSGNTAGKIKRYWGKDSEILYPPVDTGYFEKKPGIDFKKWSKEKRFPFGRKNFFLVVASFVPYKKTELALESSRESGYPLVIAGSGPLEKSYKKKYGKFANIHFIINPKREELKLLYHNAKALVYPQEEDFGIIPLEATASGTPVIAFGKGGALETVIEKKTGLFFNDQNPQSLRSALDDFNKLSKSKSSLFKKEIMVSHAKRFSDKIFQEKFIKFLEREYSKFLKTN